MMTWRSGFWGKTVLGTMLTGLMGLAIPALAVTPAKTPAATVTLVPNPIAPVLHAEPTLYEGTLWYYPTAKTLPGPLGSTLRVFWWSRLGGQVLADDAYFFPGLWVKDPNVTSLMAAIGVPTTLTYSDAAIWDRMNLIWYWMAHHTVADSVDYSTGAGFPSISDMALYYAANGYLSRGSCQSTAQVLATLLARAGIPANRIALAHAHYGTTAQHVYVILLLADGWYYLDPTYCPGHDQLPAFANRTSYGGHATCDYTHPFEINILPGSDLNSVPWCLDAD